jgi:hypothetical protein
MREYITEECCNRADRRLPSGTIDCPVHLCEKSNCDGRAELSQNERIVGCRKRQRRLGVIRIGGFSAFGPNITLSRLSASIRA